MSVGGNTLKKLLNYILILINSKLYIYTYDEIYVRCDT